MSTVTTDLSTESSQLQPAMEVNAELIGRLFARLNEAGVRYCHWKSNISLQRALSGEGDLDLLVDRRDVQQFEAILAQLAFKRATAPGAPHVPAVFHFYGLSESGDLIHLHVYYQLITGESLTKNYRLPLDEMVLQNTRVVYDVPVPERPVELIIFVLRIMLKCGSLTECLLLDRSAGNWRRELESLRGGGAESQAQKLLCQWLPSLDPRLFQRCLDCLARSRTTFKSVLPNVRRFLLARKIRKQLRGHRRLSSVDAFRLRLKILSAAVRRRLRGRKGDKQLASGGAVVAFVGADACGKSTMVSETAEWLGNTFQVGVAHLGKPPSTWLTCLPNLVGRILRSVMPRPHSKALETSGNASVAGMTKKRPGFFYRVRAVLLAWDRRALVRKLSRQAANGRLVICDRYPSAQLGVMDGRRLPLPENGEQDTLAEIEHRLYQQTPPPDVVIHLTTPVDVAIERNRRRLHGGKEHETDAYIAQRHSNASPPSFAGARVFTVDTNRSRQETVLYVRQLIWETL